MPATERVEQLLDSVEVSVEARRRPDDLEASCSSRRRRVEGDDAAAEEPKAGPLRSRLATSAARSSAPGSGERSRAGTCTPCRPAAPVRAGARSGRTRARRRLQDSARLRDLEDREPPPGRRTRRSSRRPASRSATFLTPKPTVTASKLRVGNGRASTSPSTHRSCPTSAVPGRASRGRSRGRDDRRPRALRRSRGRRCRSRRREPDPRLHHRLDREPSPPPVEPGRHDAVHDVVDRRDPVEHPPHALRLERPRLVCQSLLAPAFDQRVVDSDLVERACDDEVDEVVERLGAVVEAGRGEAGSRRRPRAASAAHAGGSRREASPAARARAAGAPSRPPKRRGGSGSPSHPPRASHRAHRARADDVRVDLRGAARVRARPVVDSVDRHLLERVPDEASQHLVAAAAPARGRARWRAPRSRPTTRRGRPRSPPPRATAAGGRRRERRTRR